MKTTKLIIAAFAALAVFSCTKSIDGGNQEKGEEVKISLKLDYPTTKGNDNESVDEDNVINDLIVFTTKSDKLTFDAAPQYVTKDQIISGVLPEFKATTAANHVYIVTNTGPLSTGIFKNATNMAQVNTIVMKVDGNTLNPEYNCKSGNVWMAADGGLTPTGDLGTDDDKNYTATLKLKYIGAKVYVKVLNNMKNYTKGGIILDGIMMVNAGAYTCFTTDGEHNGYTPNRADLGANPFYYNGLNASLYDTYVDRPADVAGNVDFAQSDLFKRTPVSFPMLPEDAADDTAAGITATMGDAEAFYLFPNITNNMTYATVYGRFDAVNGASSILAENTNHYWSAIFGEDATAISQGYKYIITIDLRGDATTGGGGTTDPTDKPKKANVIITVEAAEWLVEERTVVIE